MTDATGPLLQTPRLIADLPPHLVPRPPLWVDAALGARSLRREPIGPVEIVAADPLAVLTATVHAARGLPADRLRARVADAYIAIGHALTTMARVPIRFWNFVPSPGEAMGAGLDRYMVFNGGRFDGYAQWLCASNEFGRLLPTASAVGVVSDDLVVHCLASDTRGTPVENPRQKPAYQYSRRYGPMPPCFSRATIATLNGQRRLLVGGTASIVGEDSLHEDDVDAQVEETLRNLEALIGAALEPAGQGMALERLLDLRVYVARPEDAPAIRAVLDERCPRAERIELTTARVCRPELLVEIEGVAHLE